MFLGLEDSHDASKSTPWARKIKHQDDRLKFTVARARAHFRFVVSVLFSIFGSVFMQFCVSGLASCLRFGVVTVPLLYCLRGTETMCKLFFGCYCSWTLLAAHMLLAMCMCGFWSRLKKIFYRDYLCFYKIIVGYGAVMCVHVHVCVCNYCRAH